MICVAKVCVSSKQQPVEREKRQDSSAVTYDAADRQRKSATAIYIQLTFHDGDDDDARSTSFWPGKRRPKGPGMQTRSAGKLPLRCNRRFVSIWIHCGAGLASIVSWPIDRRQPLCDALPLAANWAAN